MRKICFTFFIGLLLMFSGCRSIIILSEDGAKQNMKGFLQSVLEGDKEKVLGFLSEEGKNKLNIHVGGQTLLDDYALEGKQEEGGMVYYEFYLSQTNKTKPYHRIIDGIAYMDPKPEFKIHNVKEYRYIEVYPEGKQVVYGIKNMEKPSTLFTMEHLPKEYKPREQPEEKTFTVSREGFNHVRLSFDKKKLAFSTYGENSFIGVYDFGTQKILPVNLFLHGNVEALAWSPNHTYLAYTIMLPVGSAYCQFYDFNRDQIIEMQLPEELTYPEYSIQNPRWIDENTVKLEVIDQAVANKINKDLLGSWRYNIKSKTMEKVKASEG